MIKIRIKGRPSYIKSYFGGLEENEFNKLKEKIKKSESAYIDSDTGYLYLNDKITDLRTDYYDDDDDDWNYTIIGG